MLGWAWEEKKKGCPWGTNTPREKPSKRAGLGSQEKGGVRLLRKRYRDSWGACEKTVSGGNQLGGLKKNRGRTGWGKGVLGVKYSETKIRTNAKKKKKARGRRGHA